jgi:serine/threonine kinase 16
MNRRHSLIHPNNPILTSIHNSNNNSMSFLYTILHYLRLCWNSIYNFGSGLFQLSNITSIIFNHNNSNNNYGKIVTFDNGMQVRIGDKIAEGGFSFVFEAFPVEDGIGGGRREGSRKSNNNNRGHSLRKKYALKRINCSDHELIQSCRHEAGVHRSLPQNHPHLMELLGLKFECYDNIKYSSLEGGGGEHKEYNVCYMLFPYIPASLRREITQRNLLLDVNERQQQQLYNQRRPFSTREVLQLFGGILDGVLAMHTVASISHRDIKLENVLLQSTAVGRCTGGDGGGRGSYGDGNQTSCKHTPILMDFGSAGPLTANLNSRQQVLTIIENAAQHTTMSYRPPELFEGGIRHATSTSNSSSVEEEGVLDFGKVDVWMLGCVLFGMMHGSSPFEVEFARTNNNEYGSNSSSNNSNNGGGGGGMMTEGLVKIVECTNLKILGEVPNPPWAANANATTDYNTTKYDGRNGRYPLAIYDFIRFMIHHDRLTRPDIQQVNQRFGMLYLDLLGERRVGYSEKRAGEDEDDDDDDDERVRDDFDSLIASRDFV